jgi:hypothetical protein
MKQACALTVALLFVSAAAAQKLEGKFQNFSVPGALTAAPAGTYLLPGTLVQDLNDAGEIIGYYTTDSTVPTHGFKRDPNGAIAVLDNPAAGTPVSGGPTTPAGTTPYALNNAGIIVGSVANSVPVTEGFLLDHSGAFQNFFAPAGSYYTDAFSINASGTITGRAGITQPDYIGLTTGYILESNGQITTFQAPDAFTTGYLNGTTSVNINSAGDSTGWYYDAAQVVHSYVRLANGVITEYSAPGASSLAYHGTWPTQIDDAGAVIGFYFDDNYGSHGYLRNPDGTFANLTLPDPSRNNQVFANWVNHRGDMVGTYTDANGAYHGYLHLHSGAYVYLSDQAAGSGQYQGTIPVRVNSRDEVAGYYIDASGVYHGFAWKLDE